MWDKAIPHGKGLFHMRDKAIPPGKRLFHMWDKAIPRGKGLFHMRDKAIPPGIKVFHMWDKVNSTGIEIFHMQNNAILIGERLFRIISIALKKKLKSIIIKFKCCQSIEWFHLCRLWQDGVWNHKTITWYISPLLPNLSLSYVASHA